MWHSTEYGITALRHSCEVWYCWGRHSCLPHQTKPLAENQNYFHISSGMRESDHERGLRRSLDPCGM